MTKEEWKETEQYKQGEFYVKWGKLLMSPHTRMSKFQKLAGEYGLCAQFGFTGPKQEQKEESHD